jgi:hypothetical protein
LVKSGTWTSKRKKNCPRSYVLDQFGRTNLLVHTDGVSNKQVDSSFWTRLGKSFPSLTRQARSDFTSCEPWTLPQPRRWEWDSQVPDLVDWWENATHSSHHIRYYGLNSTSSVVVDVIPSNVRWKGPLLWVMSSFLARAQPASRRPLNWPFNDDRSPGVTSGGRFDLWRVIPTRNTMRKALRAPRHPADWSNRGCVRDSQREEFESCRPSELSAARPCAASHSFEQSLENSDQKHDPGTKSWVPSHTGTWILCLFWFLTQLPFLSSAQDR